MLICFLLNKPIRDLNQHDPFKSKTMDSLGPVLVIIAVILGLVLYIKEISRVLNIRITWLTKSLTILLIPLFIIFAIIIIIIFSQ